MPTPPTPPPPPEKVFAERPPKGNFERKIEDLKTREKHQFKAQILAENALDADGKKIAWEQDGVEIKISSAYNVNGVLRVMCQAKKDGKELKLELPFYYLNPPIKVSTGTYRKETIDGVQYDVENFIEDPQAALKEIVFQTISAQIP